MISNAELDELRASVVADNWPSTRELESRLLRDLLDDALDPTRARGPILEQLRLLDAALAGADEWYSTEVEPA